MSWNVNQIYEELKFLMRKSQSGNITATNLFYAFNLEQNMYFQDIVGRWEARANGKQGTNSGLIRNELILTDLAPFTISIPLTIIAGEATKPSDFVYTNNLSYNGTRITHITNGQLPSVTKSVIDPPSLTDEAYYYTEYTTKYHLLPTNITGTIQLDYVASPNDVIWGFVLDIDGRQVYDPATSVQPKWSQSTLLVIIKRTLTNFGASYKDSDFTNFGRNAQMSGN